MSNRFAWKSKKHKVNEPLQLIEPASDHFEPRNIIITCAYVVFVASNCNLRLSTKALKRLKAWNTSRSGARTGNNIRRNFNKWWNSWSYGQETHLKHAVANCETALRAQHAKNQRVPNESAREKKSTKFGNGRDQMGKRGSRGSRDIVFRRHL